MPGGLIAFIIIIALFVCILIANIKVVPQANAYVIERFGVYYKTWNQGIHVKIPFMDRISKKISLKEQVVDFQPQSVITRDNVSMQIDTVVYFEVTDPKLYTYGVERPIMAIETLCATTLRNIIGELELDNTLTSRDKINGRIREILDEATDAWGIKVKRVELKNILPPREIQVAMEKQMKAERERRARILDAEGEKTSQILVAEGHKEAAILRADAIKETKIREAQGEAAAILAVQRAYADSLRMLNQAAPTDRVIALKSLETFTKVADGRATKIIIPSEIQSMASLTTSLKELVVEGEIDKTAKQSSVQTETASNFSPTTAQSSLPQFDQQAALRAKAQQVLQQNAPRQ
ncbi:MAG: SPFH/Band 7/PHB domain protein [Clostridia bacterium]|nr:SPFH/Band 7/PHB domain protein [Clostridia bacterium]